LAGTVGCADKKTLHCVDKFTFDCPDLPRFQRFRFNDPQGFRQFFDLAVLRFSSSSTQMFFDLAVLEMCGWLPPRQKATGNNLARF